MMTKQPPTNRQGGHTTGLSPAPARDASIKPVQRRLLVPLAIVLLLLVGGFDTLLLMIHHEDLEQAGKRLLTAASVELGESLTEQAQNFEAIETVILRDKALTAALKAQDPVALLRHCEPTFTQLRDKHAITHFYLHGPDRVNLLRVHKPERSGDLIERFTLREAERTRKTVSGIELGPMGTFTLRVVAPVLEGGTIIGYLELGKEIEDILDRIRADRGIELAVTIHKTFLRREGWKAGMKMLDREGDWNRFAADALTYSSASHFPEAAERLVGRGSYEDSTMVDLEVDGKPWHLQVNAVIDAAGFEVGQLFTFEDVSQETAQFNRMIVMSSGAAVLLASFLLLFLYLALRRVDRGIKEGRKQLLVAKEDAESRANELKTQKLAMDEHSIVAVVDRSGKITYANDKFCQISGYSGQELVGQDFRMINSGVHSRAFFGELWNTIAAGNVWNGEVCNRAKDGSLYWVDTTIVPFKDDSGRITEYVAIRTDITDLKRAEEASRKSLEAARSAESSSRAKSEFLANMSHEIRTPMTAILGFAENLLDADQSESAKLNCIHTIRRNGEALLAIINDILDLSKIEAGKMTIEHRDCNVCGIVAEVESLMRVRADAKGLSFNIEYVNAIPETIQSDATRMRQILINLIGNAIKFTDTGAVRLVTRFVERGDKPYLQFDVVDTGCGLNEEQQSGLFRPFVQADTSTTRKFGGTGLGLAISKRFAEMLGGDIAVVESEMGVGTTFRATAVARMLEGVQMLDDPMSATVDADAASTVTQVSPSDLRGCQVLLAEDNPTNRILMFGILKKAGAKITAVEHGKLALDAALAARDEGNPFDVVLMDMQMPIMDGYEATSQLRQKGYTRPIIALTAHAMAGDREKCINAGCDDYATKPINRAKLIQTIQTHFGKRDIEGSCEDNTSDALVSTLPYDDMHELVEMFVAELPDKIAAIEKAVDNQDLTTLGTLFHQMAGAAGGYGFPSITDAARIIESSLKTGEKLETLAEQTRALAELCRRARSGIAPHPSVTM